MADEDATNTNEESQDPTPEEAVDAAQDAAEQAADAEAPTDAEADALAAAAAAIGELSDDAADTAAGSSIDLPEFAQELVGESGGSLDLLSDVKLNVRIELGRTHMLVEDILKLGSGAVVELDKLAGDPVDVFVNDRHVAKGEVLVLNDNFCVRVSEIIAQSAEA